MSLLARFLSPLRRERVADRLLDVGRPTIAEIFRDGRILAAECGNCGSRSVKVDSPLRSLRRKLGKRPCPTTPGFMVPHCGAKLE